MQLKNINNKFFVSPQIQVKDLAQIKEKGIKTIVCNRPDNEERDQPAYETIVTEAKGLGLVVKSLPVISGNVSDEQVKNFSTMLDESDTPILAYCRTGTRSAILWTLSQAGQREFCEVLNLTNNVGYELSHLKDRFEKMA